MINGRIDFLDGPKGARHVVDGIQVSVPFVSNLKHNVDRYIQPSFSAVVNGDAVFIKGKTKPFQESLETSFDINIFHLEIPRYLEYVPFRRVYEVPSAILDVHAVLSFLQRKDGPPSVRVDGSAALHDVRITGRDKSPMIFLPSVREVISPDDMGSREFRLASVTVENPEIVVVLDKNRKLNLVSLIPEKEKGIADNVSSGEGKVSSDGADGGKEAVFSVDSIRLTGGTLRFTDDSRPAPFRTALGDIRIDVDALSTAKGNSAAASLALSTEAGESLGLNGSMALSPFASEGTLTVGKLALEKYAPYYGDSVLFYVTRGTLDLRTGYSYAQDSEGGRLLLHGLGGEIQGLRVRQRDEEEEEDFLDIPLFSWKDARLDPARREIVIGEIATGNGRVSVRRGSGGEANVSRLVPGPAVSGKSPGTTQPAETGKESAEKPWAVSLGKAAVDRYAVLFEDGATDPPAALAFHGLRLRAENVTTKENGKGTFSFAATFNREGSLSLGGSFSVAPPSLSGRLRAKNLPIGPLQPYFTKNVKILVTGGGISAEGDVLVATPKGGPSGPATRERRP